jgi:hypothetical protein
MDDVVPELGTDGQPVLDTVPRQGSGGVMSKNHLHKSIYTPCWISQIHGEVSLEKVSSCYQPIDTRTDMTSFPAPSDSGNT